MQNHFGRCGESANANIARVEPGPDEEVPADKWAGYEDERRRLLRHLRERGPANPVVITGDIHTNWALDLPDPERPDAAPLGVGFVGTSISSSGDGAERPERFAELRVENPFAKFYNAERGYVSCEVTPQTWQAHYRTVPSISRPGAPLHTRASFTVEAGRPGLQRA